MQKAFEELKKYLQRKISEQNDLLIFSVYQVKPLEKICRILLL